MPAKKLAKAPAKTSKIVVAPQQTVTTPTKVKKVKVTPTLANTVGAGWKKNPYNGMTPEVVGKKEMVKAIANSKGCTFTSTHIGKDGEPHTLVCIRHKHQNDEFGYIKVYSLRDKAERLVNPQTITALKIRGRFFKARK